MAMSGILSKWLASSPISSHRSHKFRRSNKTSTQRNSQAYYPQVQPLASLTANAREDHSGIKHMENLIKVKSILTEVDDDPMESMMIIDSLQRLAIDYHFKEEIEAMLDSVYKNFGGNEGDQIGELFDVTLFFRLLRQAGYPVSSDVLHKFINKKGRFESSLRTDIRGLLSLYEASYLNTGEDILYEANEFSSEHLTSCMGNLEPDHARLLRQTLKHPCHMTLPRYNVRHYLSHSQRILGRNGVLEELARLDFNLVQSLHQRELKEILSWWKSLGLAQELGFARDQPLKWYICPMAMLPDPQFSKCRIELAKVIAFIHIIDDIFDVYGSLDELTLFTEAISKWDVSAIETLPSSMRICYMALYNITNEIAQAVFKEHGRNPINSLKKSWTRLCNAFLQESKWFRARHVPTADEYLRNGVLSSGVCTVLMHTFFLLGQGLTKENVNFLENNPAPISCPATILRLWDDLGSAKDENQEGFDGSYVECYMKEHPDCSTQSARDHVLQMISSTWQSLNKECFSPSHFSPNLVAASLNLARMVKVMYSYDDDQNLPILEEYINMLLFKSI